MFPGSVDVVGAATAASRWRSYVLRQSFVHRCNRCLPMKDSWSPAADARFSSLMPPSPADDGAMLSGDGFSTVAVGIAAVARRCRSHVAQQQLLHRGRRCVGWRP